MENISFVLWLTLYPVSVAISGWLIEKRHILRKKKISDKALTSATLINLITWIIIGIILYK